MLIWSLFGLSLLGGALGAWLFIRFAKATGLFMDGPKPRGVHEREIPRGAGVVFYIPILLWPLVSPSHVRLLVPACLLLALGVVDDLWGMRAHWKLLAQTAVGLAAWAVGYRVLSLDLGPWFIPLGPWLGMATTVIILVGLMNAFNLIDGIDGLAGSLALVAFLALGVVAKWAGDQNAWAGALLMSGAIIGFLFLNAPPAKVFMGDLGSHTLGFLVGVLTIEALTGDEGLMAWPALLMVAVPVADTFLALARRVRARRHPFGADRGHLHHRLAERIGTKGALGLLLGLGVFSAGLGLWAALNQVLAPALASLGFVFILVLGIFFKVA